MQLSSKHRNSLTIADFILFDGQKVATEKEAGDPSSNVAGVLRKIAGAVVC